MGLGIKILNLFNNLKIFLKECRTISFIHYYILKNHYHKLKDKGISINILNISIRFIMAELLMWNFKSKMINKINLIYFRYVLHNSIFSSNLNQKKKKY